MNEYQKKALETAIYDMPIFYPALGLCGEAGEVADKVKKVIRDNNGEFSDEIKLEIAKDLGYDLSTIAEMNYEKLKSRQTRGKIGGNGDNR